MNIHRLLLAIFFFAVDINLLSLNIVAISATNFFFTKKIHSNFLWRRCCEEIRLVLRPFDYIISQSTLHISKYDFAYQILWICALQSGYRISRSTMTHRPIWPDFFHIENNFFFVLFLRHYYYVLFCVRINGELNFCFSS